MDGNKLGLNSPTFYDDLEKYSSNIYQSLASLEVSLDPDPLVSGPARLNEKTALARNHLTSVSRMFIEVSNSLRAAKKQLIYDNGILKLLIKDVVINNVEAQKYKSIKERKYYAQMLHKSEIENLNKLKLYLSDLELIVETIKLKVSDLKDVQVRIQNQVRLCQDEISTGNRWGNSSVNMKPSEEDVKSTYQLYKEQKRKDRESTKNEEVDSGCQIPDVLLPMERVDRGTPDSALSIDDFLDSL